MFLILLLDGGELLDSRSGRHFTEGNSPASIE